MGRMTMSLQLEQAQALAEAHGAEVARLATENAVQANTIERQAAQIQALQGIAERLSAEQAKVAELEGKFKTKDQAYTYSNEAKAKAENELEQAHAVLDGIEGAPSREYESGGSYSTKLQRSVVTRLAGTFVAIARGQGVVKA